MPSSSLEEMMAELDKLSELERLVATLPSSPPPSPSRNSRGLSFSVAGVGLGSSSTTTTTTAATSSSSISSSEPWENRMPSDLLDTTLSLDFGVVGSAAGVSLPVSAVSNAEPGEGRGRLLVHYVGGSVTFLLKIAVLAWSVRLLRRAWARHRSTSVAVESPPFSAISCAALRKLAELDSLDFVVVDVRDANSVSANPVSLKNLVNIPESELTTCLQLKDNAWITRFSPIKKPVAADVLVFLSTRGQRAERAAVAAAELGFNRCCVVSGGIQALVASETEDASCGVKYLGRDAVAFLLQEQAVSERQIHLVDVRRHEERSLYGYIPGSLHIPAEDWPKALAMAPSDWEKKYRFPKLEQNTLVILYSRICKRAVWVAQLCADFGLNRCYVCQSGSFHWRLNSSVLPYDGFKIGEVPPKALEFSVERMNPEVAETELRREGLDK